MTATTGERRAASASGDRGRGPLIPCVWGVTVDGKPCGRAAEVYWYVEVRDTKRNRKRKVPACKTRKPLCGDHATCRADFASLDLRSWTEPVDPRYLGVVL